MSGTSSNEYRNYKIDFNIFKPFMQKDNSDDKDIIIKGLTFHRTCPCFPEHYDVYDSNKNQVGYVRLRWGELICEYPNVGGEEIYRVISVGDEWVGMFVDDDDRNSHLLIIANKILEKINK